MTQTQTVYLLAIVVTGMVAGGLGLLAYTRPRTGIPLTIATAVVAIAATLLKPGS
ncbi:hypothetical protein [Streptomyces zaomyceticus]|uniref:hypothetical protein n=1 Tax=Streptomyces zaomyceticus TaxID=68286 RepID=UPI002E0D898A|nr:hypothetical protein OG237_44120 [Streptomyces zaomyceticus]